MATSPRVHRFKGRFMQLPRDHVNAYIVELDRSVVVIDTTIARSDARALRARAESFGKPLEAVLLTHGHPDHYTGLVEFTDLPRFASQGCLDFARQEDKVKSAVAKSLLGDEYPDVRTFPDRIVRDGEVLTFGGVDFHFADLGPGESDADGIWSFDSGGERYAFVGDVVANRCHCFMRDLHWLEWLGLLDRLDREFDPSTRIYVGHGEVPAPLDTIAWQRGYIHAFLDAVDRLRDRSVPVGRAAQEQVVAAMREYLPDEATLFLLDYELATTIPEVWKRLATSAAR